MQKPGQQIEMDTPDTHMNCIHDFCLGERGVAPSSWHMGTVMVPAHVVFLHVCKLLSLISGPMFTLPRRQIL